MKSALLIVVCLIAVPDRPAFADSPVLTPMLAQEDVTSSDAPSGAGEPDQDVTVERGTSSSSSSSSKITPVTQNFNIQGVIMLFLIAAALFPICKSSVRGR